MGVVHHGAPTRFIEELHRRFAPEAFVETGTFRGDTTEWASRVFAKVHSVEAHEGIYREAAVRLKGLPNVHAEHADTRSFLTRVVPSLKGPAVFWLDAHWCASGTTYGASDECPVLDELAIIAQSPIDHFILIDDARLFLSPPGAPHDARAWPTIRDLMRAPAIRDDRYFTLVADDVVITVPVSARDWLVEYCRDEERRRESRMLELGADLAAKGLRQMYFGLKKRVAENTRKWR
jgi:hypothetical protein